MASLRRIKAGGIAQAPGAGGRANVSPSTGEATLVRPAFRWTGQILKPTVPAQFTSWLDPNSIAFWRMLLLGASVAYVLGWHVRLFGRRIPV